MLCADIDWLLVKSMSNKHVVVGERVMCGDEGRKGKDDVDQ
jgi:hypothetical protein